MANGQAVEVSDRLVALPQLALSRIFGALWVRLPFGVDVQEKSCLWVGIIEEHSLAFFAQVEALVDPRSCVPKGRSQESARRGRQRENEAAGKRMLAVSARS